MRRIAWALLLVFSFSIPWEYSLDVGAPLGNISRIAGLCLLLAVIPALLHAGQIRTPGPVQWLVLALFLWFCTSYFWSIDPPATFERMRAYAQVMMIVWIVWELAEKAGDLRDLMRAYVGGSWVLAALTIASFASRGAADQVRFAAEGQDPNDVARFLDLGLPLAALLVNAEPRWWRKALALGYLPVGLAGVLLTASRGGFLAASIAIAGCGFLLARGHRRAVMSGVLASLAMAVAFWFVVPHATIARIATIPEEFAGGDLNQRLSIWAAGWQAFVHAPWLGSGAGSFVGASRLAQFDTAHNTALSIAVEGGVVALALALGIIVASWHGVLSMPRSARIGFGTALMVWILTSMVATVEASRSTWFLLATLSVAARLAFEAPHAMSAQFEPDNQSIEPVRSAETLD
jgi:O-antigen ligase